MEIQTKHFYNIGGLNRDVNPFMQQASDCSILTNFITPKFGVKKVRFGYTKWLDTIDSEPVRNLIYYDLKNYKGVLRVSNKKLYNFPASGSSWGASIKTWTNNEYIGNTALSGVAPYVHLSNSTDGYHIFDGSTITKLSGQYTPSASHLAAWNTRIFADSEQIILVESATDFNSVGRTLTGTVSATDGSTTITGSSTLFTTELIVGNIISFENKSYVITVITDPTHLTIATAYSGSNISGKTAYSQYRSDPFILNPNDPAGGGSIPVDSIHNGIIVDIKSSIDRVHIYKQFGIYKFNGQIVMRMPFFGNILSVCQTKNNTDYILATNGIWKNDGSTISQVDFGIQSSIAETMEAHGITNPVSFSFENYTIFYIGTIRIGSGKDYIDVENACYVHDEDYDEWSVWSLGHEMTAFGYYIDPTTNRTQMISGDVDGNTYIWGEEYSTDYGTPISYHLQTTYQHMSSPNSTKIPDRFMCVTKYGEDTTLNVAVDNSDEYRIEQKGLPGQLSKDYFKNVRDFQTISLEFIGSTSTNRPEIIGYSISYKDLQDTREDSDKSFRGK